MGRRQVVPAQQAAWPPRPDKLAANYLAFIKFASIRIWLRADESAS
jgi:transposase